MGGWAPPPRPGVLLGKLGNSPGVDRAHCLERTAPVVAVPPGTAGSSVLWASHQRAPDLLPTDRRPALPAERMPVQMLALPGTVQPLCLVRRQSPNELKSCWPGDGRQAAGLQCRSSQAVQTFSDRAAAARSGSGCPWGDPRTQWGGPPRPWSGNKPVGTPLVLDRGRQTPARPHREGAAPKLPGWPRGRWPTVSGEPTHGQMSRWSTI